MFRCCCSTLSLLLLLAACTDKNDRIPKNEQPPDRYRIPASPFESQLNGMNIYFGNLHSHTFYSDGLMSNVNALLWARDTVGYDFYAITDHAELLTQQEWDDNLFVADSLSVPGKFIALRGFEWSSNTYGHCDVFNTSDFTNANDLPDLSLFYIWIMARNGLGQFNHPGRTGNNFDTLRFFPEARNFFFSIETINRDYSNTGNTFLPFFQEALDKGWQVAPAGNQDNHSMSTTCHRTALIAAELTLPGILEAMMNRRMYSTDDPNLKIIFRFNEYWMGASVQHTGRATFFICAEDDEPIQKLELLANGMIVDSCVPARTMNSILWNPSLIISGHSFYYLKVFTNNLKDNDNSIQTAITAPIWFNVQE